MKMYTQEQVREAIMRLTMCARRECDICIYKDRPKEELPSDKCQKRATKNMNILADVCMCNVTVKAPQPTPVPKKTTLCWDCAKNCGDCSWSHDFTPVEGWEAIPTKLQAYGHAEGEIDSYKVIKCPEFELMERLKKQKKKELR